MTIRIEHHLKHPTPLINHKHKRKALPPGKICTIRVFFQFGGIKNKQNIIKKLHKVLPSINAYYNFKRTIININQNPRCSVTFALPKTICEPKYYTAYLNIS